MHAVLRSTRLTTWRRATVYRILRLVLATLYGREDFRIVHISIQSNHLHLLVEAKDEKALAAGMKSFATRAARALNREHGGCGKVFAYRYHATQIRTARHARHALAYVLNNWRRHRMDFEHAAARAAKVDPYTSWTSFDGWTRTFRVPDDYVPLPVSPPRTALLRYEWLAYGRISPFECPGPLY